MYCVEIKIFDSDLNILISDPNTVPGMGQKGLKRLCLMISLLKGYTRFGTECFCITHQGHHKKLNQVFVNFKVLAGIGARAIQLEHGFSIVS